MLKDKYKIHAIMIVLGLGYAIYDFYQFYSDDVPKLEAERVRTENELASRESELRRLTAFAQNIGAVKQELRELNLQLETELESMPRTFNLSSLLRKLNLLAQNAGVELSSFKPRPITDETPPPAVQPNQPPPAQAAAQGQAGQPASADGERKFYSTIIIDFSMKGSFTQTLIFLDQVARLKRIINVDSLKMNSVLTKGNGNTSRRNNVIQVATDATIETYRFSD